MRYFLLTRILPIIIAFLVLILGMVIFQKLNGDIIQVEGQTIILYGILGSKLTQDNAPFKGTDLEPFDMESFAAAEIILSAFQKAYPSKVSNYGYDKKTKDWFITVGKNKFLWAKGRILPEKIAHETKNWRHYVDYIYTTEPPNPANFTPQLIQEISRVTHPDYRASLPAYHIDFFDALYDGKTQFQLEQHIVPTDFLGKTLNLHQDIVPAIKRVEKDIQSEAKKNKEVQIFVDSIARVDGYNWRTIRDRQDRSFHSWGLALDILPKDWQDKNLYWSWARERNPHWMLVPLKERWIPPAIVIHIFERHGFVWGGHWIQWDNMHFEYRPELIILRSQT